MASISLKNLCKSYESTANVVKNISLDINDKEFIIFVGPSGCGKSTTLRMIAGLEEITEGEIYIGDTCVNEISPNDRDIAMVFQNYALYPNMNVYKNLSFSLRLKKVKKAEIDVVVRDIAEVLGISDLLDKKPKELSGGQRQRVALGRAMVRNPKVFLLDEPLSNLDAKLRAHMRVEISKLHKRLDSTFVYVTHDQVEAMTMADRIVVMNDGIIQQVDTPENIYNNPKNMFVAGFIGMPQINFMNAVLEVEAEDGFEKVNVDESGDGVEKSSVKAGISKSGDEFEELKLKAKSKSKVNVSGDQKYFAIVGKYKIAIERISENLINYVGKEVVLGIRPEDFYIDESGEFEFNIDICEMMGSENIIHLSKDGYDIVLKLSSNFDIANREALKFNIMNDKIHVFDKDTGDRVN